KIRVCDRQPNITNECQFRAAAKSLAVNGGGDGHWNFPDIEKGLVDQFDILPAGVHFEFLSLFQIRTGTKRFIFPCYDDTTNVDVVFDESLQRYQRFADWVG
ncbi:MAG: hypothetical protein VXZ99_10805, partial [Pseudomonadota bacterium]|nr:hypothetical protein [Pseudomonadota bacterium]